MPTQYVLAARIIGLSLTTLLCPIGAVAAQAQEADQRPRVEVLQQLYDCRVIAGPTERLACYDRQVGALQAAEAAQDIRVVDREQVRQTRRGLFGLSLPNIGSIFGDGDDNAADAEDIDQLTATLRGVRRDALGRLVYTLDNGQVWRQTEGVVSGRDPRDGQSVVIRRGAVGGFILTVEGRSGVRVQRER